MRRLEDGRSILDDVGDEAKSLRGNLGSDDRDKLDEYLTSVRELEQRMVNDESWAKKPKPKVNVEPPKDIPNNADLIGRTRLLFDLSHLALQTDSTRLITIMLAGSTSAPPIPGVSLGHHDLSHHGQDPGKLEQLALIEEAEIKVFGEFMEKMKATKLGSDTLLDRTAILYTSNLGNSSSHDNNNLPIILAGGGFKHQGHLAYDTKNNTLLSNLYVRMLQHMGVEAKSFGASNGIISEV